MAEPSQVEVNYNKDAELHLPVNLEGTAVAYPQDVAAMVGPDGEFRTDLSLNAIASLLKIDPRTTAKRGPKDEIDPATVLFTAVAGGLSEPAKTRSRRLRETEYGGLQPVLATGDEWVTVEFPFCLNAIRHPNPEQKLILDAISHSARGLTRQPGARANAVPLQSIHEYGRSGKFEFKGGYLPLEPFPVDRRMDEGSSPEDF
jgi:hypothetical protein